MNISIERKRIAVTTYRDVLDQIDDAVAAGHTHDAYELLMEAWEALSPRLREELRLKIKKDVATSNPSTPAEELVGQLRAD